MTKKEKKWLKAETKKIFRKEFKEFDGLYDDFIFHLFIRLFENEIEISNLRDEVKSLSKEIEGLIKPVSEDLNLDEDAAPLDLYKLFTNGSENKIKETEENEVKPDSLHKNIKETEETNEDSETSTKEEKPEEKEIPMIKLGKKEFRIDDNEYEITTPFIRPVIKAVLKYKFKWTDDTISNITAISIVKENDNNVYYKIFLRPYYNYRERIRFVFRADSYDRIKTIFDTGVIKQVEFESLDKK